MYEQYRDAGFRVFGLHGVTDGRCDCGNEDCKALYKHPIMSRWQATPDWDDDQMEVFELMGHFDTGYGVLITPGNLVVDVDARNGGVDSYARLVEKIPAITGAGMVTLTGSGNKSKHVPFKVPDNVALMQSHPDYPGIDFKTSGYVVGAGSMHASGNRYECVIGSPSEITDAPQELIDLLRRPDHYRGSVDGHGVDVTDTDLKTMIEHIDPDCGYEEWVRVGMALHEVTSGGGFALWDDWSKRGSKYPGSDALDKRWHSFGKSAVKVGLGTLYKYAQAAGWTQPVTFELPRELVVGTPTDSVVEAAGDTTEVEVQLAAKRPKERHQRWFAELLTDDDEALARIAAMPWLVDQVLPAQSVASLIGRSGIGKSFVVLDIACSVAVGEQWHEADTERGDVIYVSAEGGGGLRKRKRAWEQSRGKRAPGMRILSDAPLIDRNEDATLLATTIAQYAKHTGNKVSMVVLDTLNRVMEGEENSATAMGALMRGVELIKEQLQCSVLIVHHSGHGENQRARGSSAFYAALDMELTLKPIGKNVVELECTKAKDAEPFEPVRLALEQVVIDGITDTKGRDITSLVPRLATIMEQGDAMNDLSERAALLLKAISDCSGAEGIASGDEVRDAFSEATGLSAAAMRMALKRATDELLEKKKITRTKEGFRA